MKKILYISLLILLSGCVSPNLTIKDHRASFLFDNAGTRVMNILAYNLDDGYVNGVLNKCKGNDDKVIYLYVGYNKGDGAGTTSIYVDDKFGGTIDNNKINLMTSRIKKIRDKDLYIVGWFFADDNTSKINFKDTELLKSYINNVINKFDKYISEYVIGIEANEYLSATQVDQLSGYIKSLTKKPVGNHQTPGKYDFSTLGHIDKHYHQYGFNKSNSYIENETRKIVGNLGKPVIGAEYDMSSDSPDARARGDAVMRGGGSGTGNGRN